tara:strand:- start:23 stop:259 length:237 start_codon:yes stop_codon:yes gene_type:complete
MFNGVTSPKELKKAGNELTGKNIPEKNIDNKEIKKLEISPILKITIKDAEISPKPIKGIELNKNESSTKIISKRLILE